MKIPEGILCSVTHEYILTKEDCVIVGVTDVMLNKLGEIIFVEFPEKGSFYAKKEVFATIESDGAATELYMPLAGHILEINPALTDSYEALNQEPLSDGWLIKVEPADYETDIYDLYDYHEYKKDNEI